MTSAKESADRHAGRPEVTVVICTRNRLSWLRECVGSVLAQRGVTFDVVIVDDASTDGTAEWLNTLSSPRLRVIRQETRQERCVGRNAGLTASGGQFVMFLDDDDFLHPDALRVLTAGLAEHQEAVAAVGARCVWFTAEDYERRDAHPRRLLVRDVFDEVMFGWSAVSGQNLYRTEVVRSAGGYVDGLSPCEDRDLWLRVAALGRVALVPEVVMTYRLHPSQWRPADLRRIRERVARRAICRLEPGRRRHALRLRRANFWIDRAEDSLSGGRFLKGMEATWRAIAVAPAIYLSPLIGEWVLRRLVGRVARRFVPARLVHPDEEERVGSDAAPPK